MNKPLPIWAALPFGALCGAVLGTIVASFYLTLALKTGFANFDMLAVWRASDGLRRAHPEAFKVAFEEGVLRELWTNASSASSRLLTSNIQALMTAGLKQWDNPAVRSATEYSDFDFATFRTKSQSLYIAVSEDHITTLSPLLRLMTKRSPAGLA